MAKNIQVNLTFRSDTTAAKKEINSLQQSLTNLATKPLSIANTSQMQQNLKNAQQDAIELKVALERATNVDTGKLNFGKFQQELKANGKTLQDYTNNLKKIGPEGTEVFTQLGNAIRSSETPLVSLSEKAKKMTETLGNTIRWNLSSSLIQGFSSMLRGTIDYAKELNESLTNIRIVTGKSEYEMGRFADSANKAAKNLSATTTEYTNAALIYFQQGLSDKQVAERAETTLKLANVVGESAETVSDWMTSIWNNFDDGSKSLEYYGDVLATLGAKTASSADEIATGLEKFSAIADTVGLSYEYAASALATVTAETRQSADVVGTAFKTIFSRMESLELGETLDDGTTLGKYSAAMQKVGVEIKDANGQMRDMDSILSDLGEQWQFLNKDQQIALAQSVAGIRQYNQFIGLMDNWNVMEDNLEATEKATGALQYQQDIYASGMEGATKRVEASLEKLKNTLLDENDLVPLMEAGEKILTFVNDLVEAFGGLPGLLTLISSILLKMFSGQVAGFLRGMTSNITQTVNAISGKTEKDKKDSVKLVDEAAIESAEKTGGEENLRRAQFYKEDIALAQELEGKETLISDARNEQLHLMEQILELRRKSVLEAEKEYDDATKEIDSISPYLETAEVEVTSENEENDKDKKTKIEDKNSKPADQDKELSTDKKSEGPEEKEENISEPKVTDEDQEESEVSKTQLIQSGMDPEDIAELDEAATYESKVMDYEDKLQGKAGIKGANYFQMGSQAHLQATKDIYNQAMNTPGVDQQVLDNMTTAKNTIVSQSEKLEAAKTEKADVKTKMGKTQDPKELEALKNRYKELNKEIEQYKKNIKSASKSFTDNAKQAKVLDRTIDKQSKKYKTLGKEIKKYGKEQEKANKAQLKRNKGLKESEEQLKKQEEANKKAAKSSSDWAAKVTTGAQVFTTAASGIMMMKGAVDSLSDAIANDEATFGDWLSAITSVIFGMGQLVAPVLQVISLLGKKKKATIESNAEDTKTVALNVVEGVSEKTLGEIEEKEQKDDDKRTNKKLMNNIKKAMGNIGEWVSKGPVGWIVAGISAALLATIIGVAVAVNNKKVEKQNEEDFSEGTELADTTTQEIEAQNELIYNYTDIYEQYRKTGEGKDELIKKANELAEAYKNEAIAIAALNGDYEKMNSLIMEETSKSLDSQIKSLEEAEELQSGSLAYKQKEVDSNFSGYNSSFGGIAGTVLTLGISAAFKDADELEAIAAEKELKKSLKYYDTTEHKVTADLGDPEQFVDSYEEISDLAESAKTKGATTKSEIYSQWLKYLDEHKETYDQLSKQVDTKRKAKSQKKVADARSSKGNTINSTENMSEYLEIRNNLLKDAKGDEEEEERIKEALKEYGGLSEAKALKIEEFELQFGKNSEAAKGLAERIKIANDTVMKAINSIDDETIAKIEEGIITWEEAIQRNLAKAAAGARNELFEELYEDADVGEFYADTLALVNENLRENEVALNNAAMAAAKLNSSLTDAFGTWKENAGVLVSGRKDTIQYAKAVSEMSNSLKSMFGIDEELDFTNFVSNNTELIERFFTGDFSAFNALTTEVAKENAFRKGASWEAIDAIQLLGDLNLQKGESVDSTTLKKVQDVLKEGLPEQVREEILQKAGWDVTGVNSDGTITGLVRLLDESSIDPTVVEELQEELESLIDPLKEINLLIETQQNLLDRVSKAKDRAYGKTRLKYLAEETKEMENLLVLENKKLEIMESEYSKQRDNLNQYGGIVFGADGTIQDRQALEESYKQKLGNSEAFKEFQEALDQYDESLKNISEQENTIVDLKFNIEDNKIAEFVEPIELGLDFNEKDLDRLDWILSTLEDVNYSSAEKINLLSQQAAIQLDNLQKAEEGLGATLKNLFSDSEIAQILQGDVSILNTKEITAEQADKLREFVENSYNYADALKEIKVQIEEALLADFEKYNEEIEYNIDLMDKSTSVLENYKNIIGLVGKDNLGISNKILKDLSDTAVQAANVKLSATKSALDANAAALEQAKQAYANNEITEETYRVIEEQYQTSMDNFLTAWEEALTAASEAFKNSVQLVLEEFSDTIGGIYDSIDELSNWYDKEREMSDFYLKNYEKIYEINKLNRKINKSLEDNDNITAQKRLLGLQEELLEYQEEGKEMSDYDLGYLQKKYDLMQAQIALEEAQNNKTTVRLRKDSTGNYGYVYTADQNAVENAEQKYEDALYNMEKYLDDSTNALTKKYLDYSKQWSEEIAKLDETSEDYEEKAAAITEHYSKLCNMTIGEMSDMVKYGKTVNEEYGAHAAETFEETIIGKMYDDIDTFEGLAEKVNGEMKKSLETISGEWTKYKDNVDTSMQAAGVPVEEFKGLVVEHMDTAIGKVEELGGKVAGLAGEFETNFQTAIGKVSNFATQFGPAIQPAIDRVTELSDKINYILKNYDAAIEKGGGSNRGGSTTGDTNANNSTSGKGGNTTNYYGTASTAEGGTIGNKAKSKAASGAFSFTNKSSGTQIDVTEGTNISYEKGKNGTYNVKLTGRNKTTGLEETVYSNVNASDLEGMIGAFDGAPSYFKRGKKITIGERAYIQIGDSWYRKGTASDADWESLKNAGETLVKKPKGIQKVSTESVATLQNIWNTMKADNNIEIADHGTSYIPAAGSYSQEKGFSDKYGDAYLESDHPDVSKVLDIVYIPEGWQDYYYWAKVRIGYWDGTYKKDKNDDGTFDEGAEIWVPTYFLNKGWDDGADSWYSHANYKTDKITGLDTGGYTGSWGPEGRLAMLHQKEIVLNAHDTENFLAAVKIVRSISEQIETNARLAQQGLGSIITSAALPQTGQTVDQNITIHAEFPNATNHSEIEEAFRTLADRASQFATSWRG